MGAVKKTGYKRTVYVYLFLADLQSRTPKVRFFDSERMARANLLIFTASSLHCEKELIPHFFGFFLIFLVGGQNLRSKKKLYRVYAPLM